MAVQNNATCSICGSPYHKCLSCRDSLRLQPWKMFTDSAEHYKVLQVIRGYNTGVYTKDEFKSKLKNVDLSDLESYKENIKALIKDVLKEEPVIDAAEIIVEEVEEHVETMIVAEEVVVEKPVVSRKRNYKAEEE